MRVGQAEALPQLQVRGAPFGDAAVEAMRAINQRSASDRWRDEALAKRLLREGLAQV